jgi:hypothetical protein
MIPVIKNVAPASAATALGSAPGQICRLPASPAGPAMPFRFMTFSMLAFLLMRIFISTIYAHFAFLS